MKTAQQEYRDNALLLEGAAHGLEVSNPKFASLLKDAADKLKWASKFMCGQGFFGCRGGEQCGSDHK
jgi:hypothetical protein